MGVGIGERSVDEIDLVRAGRVVGVDQRGPQVAVAHPFLQGAHRHARGDRLPTGARRPADGGYWLGRSPSAPRRVFLVFPTVGRLAVRVAPTVGTRRGVQLAPESALWFEIGRPIRRSG